MGEGECLSTAFLPGENSYYPNLAGVIMELLSGLEAFSRAAKRPALRGGFLKQESFLGFLCSLAILLFSLLPSGDWFWGRL